MMKLLPELVPETAWCKNLRSSLPKSEWDKLRRHIYKRANYKCEICGGVGPKHPIECHENWKYDEESGVQILVGLEGLCPACHEVKHIGLARVRGRYNEALKHMCKVNKISKSEAEVVVSNAFSEWTRRSGLAWKCNKDFLEEIRKEMNDE